MKITGCTIGFSYLETAMRFCRFLRENDIEYTIGAEFLFVHKIDGCVENSITMYPDTRAKRRLVNNVLYNIEHRHNYKKLLSGEHTYTDNIFWAQVRENKNITRRKNKHDRITE